jgi:hypothetical protein
MAELMISFRLTFSMFFFYFETMTLSLPKMKLSMLVGSLLMNGLVIMCLNDLENDLTKNLYFVKFDN